MSPEFISARWLSLRSWLLQTVLPAALCLVAVLLLLRAIGPSSRTLNHTAALVGFTALYFILFRGGHLLMIRSLHFDMLRRHEDAYRERLAKFTADDLKRRNLGFTLARVKRDILIEARKNPHKR